MQRIAHNTGGESLLGWCSLFAFQSKQAHFYALFSLRRDAAVTVSHPLVPAKYASVLPRARENCSMARVEFPRHLASDVLPPRRLPPCFFVCAHGLLPFLPRLSSSRALQVKKKINGSFSGGQETKELQELHGANIHVRVVGVALFHSESLRNSSTSPRCFFLWRVNKSCHPGNGRRCCLIRQRSVSKTWGSVPSCTWPRLFGFTVLSCDSPGRAFLTRPSSCQYCKHHSSSLTNALFLASSLLRVRCPWRSR